jgi:hypothetical protein
MGGTTIVGELPPLLAEFQGKKAQLLYRGSLHGFTAKDFHDHCDNKPFTVTLIQDENQSIFGGFTPLAFPKNTRNGTKLPDPSGESFLFSLHNHHGRAPLKFPLRPAPKNMAITYNGRNEPVFGEEDLVVKPEGNNLFVLTRRFGTYYDNAAVASVTFLTRPGSSGSVKVKEIEVFEITGERYSKFAIN